MCLRSSEGAFLLIVATDLGKVVTYKSVSGTWANVFCINEQLLRPGMRVTACE
jgi:hypothetical protein